MRYIAVMDAGAGATAIVLLRALQVTMLDKI